MSINRLEPTRRFVDRIILLNRFHAPDEEDYEGARAILARLHKHFPDGAVHEQAAYVVAAIVHERPFSEANFRTAWDYVADMLDHRGYHLNASLAEAQQLGNMAWDAAQDGLDGLQTELADWFKPRVHQG